jgi:L-histidine Nalpha-methyltransferase / hercynylcysteine S-oxide synthase
MQDYQMRVRARILDSYRTGEVKSNRRLARGLWLAYEHEAMHLETFLYMLIQSDKVLPPPGREIPDFKHQATAAAGARVANVWHNVPATKVNVGLDDPENDNGPDRFFGWDNERPKRTVSAPSFEAQSRPISNAEYAHYLEATKTSDMPASWSHDAVSSNGDVNGFHQENDFPSTNFISGKTVRTVWGQIPLKYALDWPVMASYDELAAYAKWANGRIPTFEEVKSIYNYVQNAKIQPEKVPSKLISAVNG